MFLAHINVFLFLSLSLPLIPIFLKKTQIDIFENNKMFVPVLAFQHAVLFVSMLQGLRECTAISRCVPELLVKAGVLNVGFFSPALHHSISSPVSHLRCHTQGWGQDETESWVKVPAWYLAVAVPTVPLSGMGHLFFTLLLFSVSGEFPNGQFPIVVL